jgi:hypothetical protein
MVSAERHPLVRYGVGNAIVVTVPLLLWLLADYLWVGAGQDPESVLLSPVLGFFVLGAVPLGLSLVNWPICRRRSAVATFALTALLVSALSAAWFIVAYSVVMNFHFYLGGTH